MFVDIANKVFDDGADREKETGARRVYEQGGEFVFAVSGTRRIDSMAVADEEPGDGALTAGKLYTLAGGPYHHRIHLQPFEGRLLHRGLRGQDLRRGQPDRRAVLDGGSGQPREEAAARYRRLHRRLGGSNRRRQRRCRRCLPVYNPSCGVRSTCGKPWRQAVNGTGG